ncbi:2-amino-4-hydroxy-6-hydroxymethyldihydropteridine diphosphokinase [Erythrobacter sp. SDW2]|uniref:2-amino-4-hydroxy-6- hydroxymethyldihydropteridine diphosphokinase n=1 Tax=Erythrobacter sp. SDW2 TaxID=2907154 RepID=UPI001F1CB742|nr:2-amino-4-hydroxy-6-hydroxymethyldihydropteridine diphosphokinase [Erythrobacter sp. SDW2]UIP07636.1 2-amino-4-hydroxy-6-hydroxymethyldihydropteridine diphosphokinase [Erythrobacter sp. SDW2]
MRTAMEELAALGTVTARSAVISTAPMGPSARRFANAALLLDTELDPASLLAALQRTEREFGRRRWRRWGDRVIDLDIVLWSEGSVSSSLLTIPHQEFRGRDFVLVPASNIAPGWRDPRTGLTLLQAKARLTRKRPLP